MNVTLSWGSPVWPTSWDFVLPSWLTLSKIPFRPTLASPTPNFVPVASPGFLLNIMIAIKKSATADTRTCDFANTTKETLLASSRQHIGDVVKALLFFSGRLGEKAGEHDYDKLTAIDWFHADFVTGFKETGWWDNHRKIHRHHLAQEDGVPQDVNLLDILEYIADCVMAGMARSGSVTDLVMTPEMLERAFKNTVELLKNEVQVAE